MNHDAPSDELLSKQPALSPDSGHLPSTSADTFQSTDVMRVNAIKFDLAFRSQSQPKKLISATGTTVLQDPPKHAPRGSRAQMVQRRHLDFGQAAGNKQLAPSGRKAQQIDRTLRAQKNEAGSAKVPRESKARLAVSDLMVLDVTDGVDEVLTSFPREPNLQEIPSNSGLANAASNLEDVGQNISRGCKARGLIPYPKYLQDDGQMVCLCQDRVPLEHSEDQELRTYLEENCITPTYLNVLDKHIQTQLINERYSKAEELGKPHDLAIYSQGTPLEIYQRASALCSEVTHFLEDALPVKIITPEALTDPQSQSSAPEQIFQAENTRQFIVVVLPANGLLPKLSECRSRELHDFLNFHSISTNSTLHLIDQKMEMCAEAWRHGTTYGDFLPSQIQRLLKYTIRGYLLDALKYFLFYMNHDISFLACTHGAKATMGNALATSRGRISPPRTVSCGVSRQSRHGQKRHNLQKTASLSLYRHTIEGRITKRSKQPLMISIKKRKRKGPECWERLEQLAEIIKDKRPDCSSLPAILDNDAHREQARQFNYDFGQNDHVGHSVAKNGSSVAAARVETQEYIIYFEKKALAIRKGIETIRSKYPDANASVVGGMEKNLYETEVTLDMARGKIGRLEAENLIGLIKRKTDPEDHQKLQDLEKGLEGLLKNSID